MAFVMHVTSIIWYISQFNRILNGYNIEEILSEKVGTTSISVLQGLVEGGGPKLLNGSVNGVNFIISCCL